MSSNFTIFKGWNFEFCESKRIILQGLWTGQLLIKLFFKFYTAKNFFIVILLKIVRKECRKTAKLKFCQKGWIIYKHFKIDEKINLQNIIYKKSPEINQGAISSLLVRLKVEWAKLKINRILKRAGWSSFLGNESRVGL